MDGNAPRVVVDHPDLSATDRRVEGQLRIGLVARALDLDHDVGSAGEVGAPYDLRARRRDEDEARHAVVAGPRAQPRAGDVELAEDTETRHAGPMPSRPGEETALLGMLATRRRALARRLRSPEKSAMRAMLLTRPRSPLVLCEIDHPAPGPGELLLRVRACGVCRTDLHVVDGELRDPKLPLILGHEIVGEIEALGPGVDGFALTERVGVPWLGGVCGRCRHCVRGRENLCDDARLTGYTRDGGYAELAVADARFVFRIPRHFDDVHAAPLLCAGLIGWRAYRMCGDAARIGLHGFGAAAHILAQIAKHEGREVFAFTRPGDSAAQRFARSLGAVWAGGSDELPPAPLDAAILFAPVGALVPQALRAVDKGGVVVCAGIHMSEIPAFPYELLWHERAVRSVANLTRADGDEFFARIAHVPIETQVTPFPLARANEALFALRDGALDGAAVLVP